MTETASPHTEEQLFAATAPHQTKAALLRARLTEPGGASLSEMMRLTGWQAHTLRAALSGLCKTGVILSGRREGGETIYAIEPAGPARATDGEVGQDADAIRDDSGIAAQAPAVPPVTAQGLSDADITESGKGAA